MLAAAVLLALVPMIRVPSEAPSVQAPGEEWATDGRAGPAPAQYEQAPLPVRNQKQAPCTEGVEVEPEKGVRRLVGTARRARGIGTSSLTPSLDFEGSLFLEFENGGALWHLSWRTPDPGVTLYRWNYRRKKPNASWKERAAQKAEELPREEIALRGELAEQAIRAAYGRGKWPKGFQGQVYLPVDCR